METILQILEAAVFGTVVAMGVFLVVVIAVCAIAPLFITDDMTEGDDPAVKIGQGE